jgi:RNA polymerase sigma factor (sigma-70 family)
VNYRELYESHLDQVEEIINFVCRRNGLQPDQAEDFRGEIHVKLISEDYAVFRKFQQKSSLRTYLSMVIQHAFQDFRNKIWGKWRPSTKARKLGETAIRLEMLTHRDGYTLTEAVQVLLTNEGVTEDETALHGLFAQLPNRERRMLLNGETLETLQEDRSLQDTSLVKEEAENRKQSVEAVLSKALGVLEPEDHFIVTMHFFQGITVPNIARTLQVEQKPLYRRIHKILERLGEVMRQEGIMKEDVSEMLTDLD